MAYPFNRRSASSCRPASATSASTRELQTQGFSLDTGEQVFEEEQDLERPAASTSARAAAALVHDTSVFGVTSPILGQRYRLEVLADGRHA